MVLDRFTIKYMETQCGRKIRSSADCEYLALDIESLTGERIGVNTIKRLLGFIKDERNTRITTLDIIARYLGCESWEQLSRMDQAYASSAFTGKRKEVVVRQLEIGRRIRIIYYPKRNVVIEYKGDCHFIVLESENSKLLPGDELVLTHIIERYPLWVSEVFRDGESLGSFTTSDSTITYRLLPMPKQKPDEENG